jgi:hypothetical protein
MSWLVVRLGPVQSRTSENRMLAHTDEHGQEHSEAGSGQGRAGASPVPDQVPQRDPDRDRSPRARKASQQDEA